MSADKPKEEVNHPTHYGGDVVYEAKKVIRAWRLGFNVGNAVKYLCRAGKKGVEGNTPVNEITRITIRDLEKAKWYIQDEIDFLKEELDSKTITSLPVPLPTRNKENTSGTLDDRNVLPVVRYNDRVNPTN